MIPHSFTPFKHLKFVLYDRTGISGEFDNGSNIVYKIKSPHHVPRSFQLIIFSAYKNPKH